MKKSFIYILSNSRKTVLYIGVTSDLERRIQEHKEGNGSIFTKKYNVNELLHFEIFSDIKQAIDREKKLKNWHKEWKWNLIKENNPNLLDLYKDLSL